jgi:predicted transcriptional regulator
VAMQGFCFLGCHPVGICGCLSLYTTGKFALTIKPEVEALIRRQMKSGHFKNVDDVIEAFTASPTRSELDALIQEGIDDIERGDVFTEEEARAYIAAARPKL